MEKDTVKDLKILILLNAWDGIISYIGVFTKNIEEYLINSGGYSPSKAVKKLIKTALFLYTAVSLIHVFWIIKAVIFL